jgi:hypothetical protein
VGDAARSSSGAHAQVIGFGWPPWCAFVALQGGTRPLRIAVTPAPRQPSRVSIVQIQPPARRAVLREFCTAGFSAAWLRCAPFSVPVSKAVKLRFTLYSRGLAKHSSALRVLFSAVRKHLFRSTAQIMRHPPVDGLHHIENKLLKTEIVFLTLFPHEVQHTRSLTVSKVFPVGGESGAQTSSLRPSTELEVISESGDGSCWRPGTAVPRREGESSCISFPARRCWEGNQVWRPQRRQGLGSATLQVLDCRKTIGPRAGRNPAHGQSGRSDEPDGLPAANWQAC